MTAKKLPKLKKKDRDWQEIIKKNIEKEDVKLDHPQGLERFQSVLKKIGRKKND